MIDYEFIVETYSRYHKHLLSIKESLETNIAFYERSVTELERLVAIKPEVYLKELKKMKQKIVEADIKLSHVIPRIKKLEEQTDIIRLEKNIPKKTFASKDEAWTGK